MIDLTDPAVQQDPYPLYARLRRDHPLARTKQSYIGDAWLVSRYEDVMLVHKDGRFVNNAANATETADGGSPWWLPRLFRLLQDSMVMQDDSDHRRLRTLVHQAFTPRRVQEMATRADTIVTDLLDAAERRGEMDIVSDFALPLPLILISEMMGVPEADRQKFHKWSAAFLEAPSAGGWEMVKQTPNALRMLRFFQRLIADRRRQPGDDLISALVQAEADGERLNEDELLSMIFLLLLAGHETTVNLIGSGALALMHFPEQRQLLAAQPERIDSAIEELLRFTNPVTHGTMRYAREPVEICGQTIAPGEVIVALLASANRDEAVFDRPDVLDITRQPNKHIAFGFGLHYCLGAPLARLEARAAIPALLQRFPNYRLAIPAADVVWRPTAGVRGLASLPVVLTL